MKSILDSPWIEHDGSLEVRALALIANGYDVGRSLEAERQPHPIEEEEWMHRVGLWWLGGGLIVKGK